MKNNAATATDVNAASQGGYGRDDVWQPPEALQALVADGCGTLIPELIAIFKKDADARLQAVDNAIVSGNLPLVRQHVHSLKGCARQLGAEKMASICEQIELAGPETPISELPGQLKELEVAFERVVRAMNDYA